MNINIELNELHRNRYAGLMEMIRHRLDLAEVILNRPYQLLSSYFDMENIALQFRKILESIAMSSLVAHKDEYEKVHQKFAEHWNAKKIIAVVERINPNFFPVARLLPEDFAGFINLAHAEALCPANEFESLPPIFKGQLKKDEYNTLYNFCSEYIHTKNPFSATGPNAAFTLNEFRKYHAKIKLLMECHRTNVLEQGYYYTLLNSREHGGQSMVYQIAKVDPGQF